MKHDKARETERYNSGADFILRFGYSRELPVGANSVPEYLREPYLKFESEIKKSLASLGPKPKVLEFGAGTGNYTAIPVLCGAVVTASDLAESALAVLRDRYSGFSNLSVALADIEGTYFSDESFDLIMCAGVLSYGNHDLVLTEVERLLKPGGFFVCVDSLNHNPIYRLNRYIHFLRGSRTASTLRRMPTLDLLDRYRARFESCFVWYFGCVSWLMPFLSRVVGLPSASRLSRCIDRLVSVKGSAFKYVMTARKMK